MANRTKEYDAIYQAKWRAANREKTRASALRYYYKKKDDPDFKVKIANRYKAWVAANPEGNRRRNRQYRKAKPERFSIYQIRKNYGVTLKEAAILLARRKLGCEICGRKTNSNIDHDHATGKIRGILCSDCNRALGCVRDISATLRALADYLERN